MKCPEKTALKDSPFCKTEIYMAPLFGTHEHNTYQTNVCNTTIIFNIFEFVQLLVIIIIFHFHFLSKKTFYLGTAFNNILKENQNIYSASKLKKFFISKCSPQ